MSEHKSSTIPRRRGVRRGHVSPRLGRGATALVLSLAAVMLWSATASAQLDPLLFVKRVPPTIIIVMDTSLRMLEDGAGNYYDPNTYSSTADPGVMDAFPTINPATQPYYRRVYRGVTYDPSPGRYAAASIVASPGTTASRSEE